MGCIFSFEEIVVCVGQIDFFLCLFEVIVFVECEMCLCQCVVGYVMWDYLLFIVEVVWVQYELLQ